MTTALPEEVTTLVAEARADKRPGTARIQAMWAGIAAGKAGLPPETTNPFDRIGEDELADAFTQGLRMGLKTPLPRAAVHDHPRRWPPRTGTTHAAHSVVAD